jgi:hypothetical protein
MTEGEESYERVVAQLAQMPDVIAQLLRDHEADGRGPMPGMHQGRDRPPGRRVTHALSRASRVAHWRSARAASGDFKRSGEGVPPSGGKQVEA